MAASGPRAPYAEPGIGGRRGAMLLLVDLRIAYLVANEFRYRLINSVVAGSGPQLDAEDAGHELANLVTVVGASILGRELRARTSRLARRPSPPAIMDGILVAAGVRGILEALAGPQVGEVPGSGTLLALALVGRVIRPAHVRWVERVGTTSQRVATGFHHRYGYLVDPGHRRELRARAKSAVTSSG